MIDKRQSVNLAGMRQFNFLINLVIFFFKWLLVRARWEQMVGLGSKSSFKHSDSQCYSIKRDQEGYYLSISPKYLFLL